LFYNSTSNKRGVGILIKNTLPFSDLQCIKDPEENFLLLRLVLKGKPVIIGSIYGPNTHDRNFFTRLGDCLINEVDNFPIILGGDWNCTLSTDAVADNIDILNMQHAPSMAHSLSLRDCCARLKLTDPFRMLYPLRREFTYIPRCVDQKNRSRLDFFLMSQSVANLVTSCSISPCLQNKLFDHKAIFLSFIPNKVISKRPTIDPRICSEPDIELVVSLATIECYLLHSDLVDLDKEALTRELGQAFQAFRNIGPDPVHLLPDASEAEDILNRDGSIARIRLFIENFPFDRVKLGPLNIDDDLFMEVLINNIRNAVISHQSFISKKSKETLSRAYKKLFVLKKSFVDNQDEIFMLESFLNNRKDLDMRAKLEKHSQFEILNNEKITPYFLQLAKSTVNDALLSDIRDNNDSVFSSVEEQRLFIRKYFEGIYEVDPHLTADVAGCIETFLGADILNSNIVRSSKLTVCESESLESHLSLDELDLSIQQSKNSAAGLDGFNNSFIKKFWHIFRHPLHRYSACVIGKGRLTENFRSALLRLIPKKGDCSKIKNWRPITLLSCFYKTISCAINNRLKKCVDIIFSRAQKGFTPHRYIQEVFINVVETIAYTNYHNIPACMLSLDQAKAFDSVSHKYMSEVYRFFNFGPAFINMLETYGNNRTASIIFDDGSISVPFNLGTGRAQGDNKSPIEYNFAQQILIFKIELDPNVASVYHHLLVPRPVSVVAEYFDPVLNIRDDTNRFAPPPITVCHMFMKVGDRLPKQTVLLTMLLLSRG
jgi:exonuclease III